jgi:hypothetical protein
MPEPYLFFMDFNGLAGQTIHDVALIVPPSRRVVMAVDFPPVAIKGNQYVRAWGKTPATIDKVELREWNRVLAVLWKAAL